MSDVSEDRGQNDLQRLVAAIEAANDVAALPRPRQPWLPELPPLCDLVPLLRPVAADAHPALVFGLRDDPANQAQPVVAFEPDTQGNLAVYGTSGSGKSALLRTLAVVAGFPAHAGPCQVYALDFGTRGLAMLDGLPHVGAVINGGEDERVERLVSRLAILVAERNAAYKKADCDTITDYRVRTGNWAEPRILLLIDNFPALRAAYETTGERAKIYALLNTIAVDGRQAGVHVVLTADRGGSLPPALASTMQRRVVLRMTEDHAYVTLGEPTGVLKPTSPPGRGLIGGSEIQVAILGSAPAVGDQAANIRVLAREMIEDGVGRAEPVAMLAEHIPLADLPAEQNAMPVFGRDQRDLRPVGFTPHGTFLIAGPADSGRTTAMHTLARALHRWRPGARLFHLAAPGAPAVPNDRWERVASGPETARDMLVDFAKAVAAREADRPTALFVDGLIDYLGHDALRTDLEAVVTACAAGHALFVAQSDPAAFRSVPLGHAPLLGRLRNGSAGLLLMPDASDPQVFPAVSTARLDREAFPKGRGIHLDAGKTAIVQVAWTETEQ